MSSSTKLIVDSLRYNRSRIEFERFDDNSLGLYINGEYGSVSKKDRIELAKFLLPILDDLEGEFLTYDHAIRALKDMALLDSASKLDKARAKFPEWKPGDVIAVTFPSGATRTYVRGSKDWHSGEGECGDDDTVNIWYKAGFVKPLLQSGGEEFDKNRIPGGVK